VTVAACDSAIKERDALNAQGVQDLVKQDPRALSASGNVKQIRDVHRYIALQELVLFKCPFTLPPLVLAGQYPPPPERRPHVARPPQRTTKPAPEPAIPLPVRNIKRI